MTRLGRRLAIALLIAAALLGGCDGGYPRDPDGTLQRVAGATMIVGVAHDPPLLVVAPGQEPRGPEADLLRAYARTLGARIRWVPAGNAELMHGLEERRLHAVAGGHGSASPWDGVVGFSTPYDVAMPDGPRLRRRLAVPPGENAWLMRFETFLRTPAARAIAEPAS